MKTNKNLYSLALLSASLILVLIFVSSLSSAAPYAYITNMDNKNVSVIDTATNNVIGAISVGFDPLGVVVNSAGTKIYVTNEAGTVSIIDASTNKVTAAVEVGGYPYGIAVTPDGTKVYVTDRYSNNVSVIDTATNKVTDTVEVGEGAVGVAVTPDGTKAYVTNLFSKIVSVIDTAANKVIKTVCVGDYPTGVAVNPDGTKAYVVNANQFADNDLKSEDGLIVIMSGDEPIGTVSVIDTATNKVTAKSVS